MPLFLPFACNHSFSTHSCVLLLVTLTFSAKLYVCVEFLPSWWQPLHPSLATLYAPHIFRTLPTKLKHTSKYGGSWKGSRRRGQTYCQTWSVLVICKCCSWVVLLLLVSYFCFTFFFHKMWRLHRYRLFEHNHWGLLWNAAAASACGHIAPEHIHTYILTNTYVRMRSWASWMHAWILWGKVVIFFRMLPSIHCTQLHYMHSGGGGDRSHILLIF